MNSPLSWPKKLSFLVLPVIGTAFILWVNFPFKLGVSPDSVSYLSMAKHIAAGKGVQVYMANLSTHSSPIAHFPPFYPFVLALFVLLKWEFAYSTWVLNCALFGINIFFASFLIYRLTKSIRFAWLTGWLFLFDTVWLGNHSWILTEPLYIFEVNLSLFYLWKYSEENKRERLFSSAVAAGLSSVTKYMGFANGLAGTLCVLCLTQGSWIQKIRRSFMYGIVSLLPFVYWGARNFVLTRKPGQPFIHSAFSASLMRTPSKSTVPLTEQILSSWEVTGTWLKNYFPLPLPINLAGTAVFFITLFILFFILYQKKSAACPKPLPSGFPLILTIHAVIFTLCLDAALRMTYASFTVPDRYMIMVFTNLIMLGVIGLYWLSANLDFLVREKKWQSIFKQTAVILLIIWSAMTIFRTYEWAQKVRQIGADESHGLRWRFVNNIPWFPPEASKAD